MNSEMTKKQAIKILESYRYYEYCDNNEENEQAFDMAISALSDLAVAEEECEQLDKESGVLVKDLVKGDCISRKSVLELCNSLSYEDDENDYELGYNCALLAIKNNVEKLPTIPQTDSSVIAKIKRWSESPEYSYGERNVMKVILQELEDTIPQTDISHSYMVEEKAELGKWNELTTQTDSVLEKQSLRDYLTDLRYEIYHELCKEIHKDEECPCTNQTTSCLAKFRVCDANRAIGRIIDKRIKNGRVPCGITCADSVLEKIKTEIEEYQKEWDRNANDYEFGYYQALDRCLDIIEEHISRKE